MSTNGDEVEQYMERHWCNPVVAQTEPATGTRWHDADRAKFESHPPESGSLFYFGHGSEEALGEPPIIDTANVSLVQGTLVAVACDAAEGLGPAAIAQGTQAFVGFTGRIPVIADPKYDEVFVEHLSDLASDRCSAMRFRAAFRAGLLALAERAEQFPDQYANAPLLLVGADSARGSVRVLER